MEDTMNSILRNASVALALTFACSACDVGEGDQPGSGQQLATAGSEAVPETQPVDGTQYLVQLPNLHGDANTLRVKVDLDQGPVSLDFSQTRIPREPNLPTDPTGPSVEEGEAKVFLTAAPDELAALGVCSLQVQLYDAAYQMVDEETVVLSEAMFDEGPYIESHFNVQAGDYFFVLMLQDCEGNMVDACAPLQTETVTVTAHDTTAVKAQMRCIDEAVAPGFLGVAVDIQVRDSAIEIISAVLSKIVSWTYRAVHAVIEASCPDGSTCTYSWWVVAAPEGLGAQGEYLLLNTSGPEAWLSLPKAGMYTLKVIVDDGTNFNWFLFDVITAEDKPGETASWPLFQCDSTVAFDGAPENKASSQVFSQYNMEGALVEGQDYSEIGTLIPAQPCERSVSTQLDSPDGTIFLLKQSFAGAGPLYFEPTAVATSDANGFLAETTLDAGAAYLMLIERHTFTTAFVADVTGGCCTNP